MNSKLEVPGGLAFARLQQLISPSLPIGSFTYSQGMEWAVEEGWISEAEDVYEWVYSLMYDSLQWMELPLLLRLYRAVSEGDEDLFQKYSLLLLAGRETSELRLEEQQRARALVMILNKLPDVSLWKEFEPWQDSLLKSQAAGFAMASYYWGISERDSLRGYVWAWLENMVSVAVKLVPLGQSDGQRILYRLGGDIEEVCDHAYGVEDGELGASAPAMAIASSLHETQYCRLFRS